MRTPLTIALLLFHIWMQPLHAMVVRELLPVDEAVHRPDFFSFRAGLLVAVGRRDAAAIRSVVHPNIRNTFGPDVVEVVVDIVGSVSISIRPAW